MLAMYFFLPSSDSLLLDQGFMDMCPHPCVYFWKHCFSETNRGKDKSTSVARFASSGYFALTDSQNSDSKVESECLQWSVTWKVQKSILLVWRQMPLCTGDEGITNPVMQILSLMLRIIFPEVFRKGLEMETDFLFSTIPAEFIFSYEVLHSGEHVHPQPGLSIVPVFSRTLRFCQTMLAN